MRLFPLLLFAATSLAFAPAPFPKAAKRTPASIDLAAMQGRWERISLTVGRAEMGAQGGNIRIVGQKVAFYLGDRLREEWSISLRPDAGANRFKAEVISGDFKGSTITGTYHRDGDVLALAYEMPTIQVIQGLGGDVPEQLSIVRIFKKERP
jgi:hypothetical protein